MKYDTSSVCGFIDWMEESDKFRFTSMNAKSDFFAIIDAELDRLNPTQSAVTAVDISSPRLDISSIRKFIEWMQTSKEICFASKNSFFFP